MDIDSYAFAEELILNPPHGSTLSLRRNNRKSVDRSLVPERDKKKARNGKGTQAKNKEIHMVLQGGDAQVQVQQRHRHHQLQRSIDGNVRSARGCKILLQFLV